MISSLREIPEGETIKILHSGIKINEKGPEPKKLKGADQPKLPQLGGPSNQGGSQTNIANSSKGLQQQKAALVTSSAPPKLQGSKPEGHGKGVDQSHLSVTGSQSLENIAPQPQIIDDIAEKVHIPNTFVESNAESETLSERLRKIDAYNDEEQGGSQVNENNSEQQAWFI
jgi:hypothetical protein